MYKCFRSWQPKLAVAFVAILLIGAGSNYPSAPFNSKSADLINSNYDLESVKREFAGMVVGTPEAYELHARYMSKAFKESGYSLDETIYKYLKDSTPSDRQMHIFVQRLQLGTIVTAIDYGKEYERVILRSGAMSERTVRFYKEKSK